jgi:HSP20 family protein
MDTFDEEFERMRRMLNKLFNEALRDFEFAEEPFVYGFTMRTGPDGVPEVREFGHQPRQVGSELGTREPLTDIIESEDEVFVTVELPGVDQGDIDVTISPTTLKVVGRGENRYYHKEISLPVAVREEDAKTTFKNGVLDVVLRKVKSADVDAQ